jgi:small nuclear ribonucleoprotein (snRNP)-like protein
MEKSNVYLEELKKFIGKECEVTDASGNKYKGVCKGLNFNYLNIILMTDKEKIIIRNIANVRRLRSAPSEPVKPANEKSVKAKK